MKQMHTLKAATAIAGTVVIAATGFGAAVAVAATDHSRPAITQTGTPATTGSTSSTSSTSTTSTTGTSTTTSSTSTTPVTVTVRIEGLKKTLLLAKKVTLKAGTTTRDGHVTSNLTAQGALNAVTKGRWAGYWDASMGWDTMSILGERDAYMTEHGFKGTKSYWALFVNTQYASFGASSTVSTNGEVFTFAAVGNSWNPGDLTALSAPAKATKGRSFTVKAFYYTSAGKKEPLAGASVEVAGKTYKTGKAGTVKVAVKHIGTVTLTESKAGYVRDEATVKVVK